MTTTLYALEKQTGINRGTISKKCKDAQIDTSKGISDSDLYRVYGLIGYDPNKVKVDVLGPLEAPGVYNGQVSTLAPVPSIYIESLTINLVCSEADTEALDLQTQQIKGVTEQARGMIAKASISKAGAQAETLKAQNDNFLAQLGLATTQEIAKKLGLTQESE
jgi:hypothetical protein